MHDDHGHHSHHYHIDPAHTPDGGDHHLPPDEGAIEDNPLWQRDNVTLWSVGIDIGSAGTQILFSRVHLQRQAVELSSRYIVIDRETMYESPVSLTPYKSETLIDDRALGALVDNAYAAAHARPEDIDTGVVILTGEALRRENASRIAQILSEKCGDLVCATAGHHMEARLAAYGSGAARQSFDDQSVILNIDIGGGTTKLSLIDCGDVVQTAAVHIGGRLLAVNDDGTLDRLDPAGKTHARNAGFNWSVGDVVTGEQLDQVAAYLADTLVDVLTGDPPSERASRLYLTDPIDPELMRKATHMVFSGGVAEFVYHREERDFGDLGRRLGLALRERADAGALPWTLLPDSQGIRSTALGASEYTTQLSGNTCFVTSPETLLPRRNIQVVQPPFEFTESFKSADLGNAIQRHLEEFEFDAKTDDVVLALHWTGTPEYPRLRALAEGIQSGMSAYLATGKPLYVVLDADIAMTLGHILRDDLSIKNEILVLDGVTLTDFDYIDVGKVRKPSNTMPVTIKSLIFNDAMTGHRPERIHHNEKEALNP